MDKDDTVLDDESTVVEDDATVEDTEDIEVAEETEETTTSTPEQQTAAKDIGWVPLEDFKGDPSKWVDADAFLDRADHVMPILRQNNKKLNAELNQTRQQIEQLRAESAENAKIVNALAVAANNTMKVELTTELETTRAALKQAITDQDIDLQTDLTEKLSDVKQRIKEAEAVVTKVGPKTTTQTVSPETKATFDEWLGDGNSWYKKPALAAAANAIAVEIIKEAKAVGETPLKGRPLLDEITKRMDNEFNVSKRTTNSKVESGKGSGGTTTTTINGKGRFNELPSKAKQVCQSQASKYVGEGKAFKTLGAWQRSFADAYFE